MQTFNLSVQDCATLLAALRRHYNALKGISEPEEVYAALASQGGNAPAHTAEQVLEFMLDISLPFVEAPEEQHVDEATAAAC